MARIYRFRRFAKWTCTVGSVVIAAASVVSESWCIAYRSNATSSYSLALVQENSIQLFWNGTYPYFEYPVGWTIRRPIGDCGVRGFPPFFAWGLPRASFNGAGGKNLVWIPIWLPFVLGFFASSFLWYLDRRPPVGHCKTCGYDLTGNTSGRCSECGADCLPANKSKVAAPVP